MTHIKKYNDFLKVNEKAIFIKAGQHYISDDVKGTHGMVKVYYNEHGILGPNDRHIPWDELVKLRNKFQ